MTLQENIFFIILLTVIKGKNTLNIVMSVMGERVFKKCTVVSVTTKAFRNR